MLALIVKKFQPCLPRAFDAKNNQNDWGEIYLFHFFYERIFMPSYLEDLELAYSLRKRYIPSQVNECNVIC